MEIQEIRSLFDPYGNDTQEVNYDHMAIEPIMKMIHFSQYDHYVNQ